MTRPDRKLIATGLREGLGYAEIARRLQRPTSTISREVARNGGIYAYRADRAHQASSKRARRRVAPQEQPVLSKHEQEYVRRLVDLMIYTGVPKTAARVLTCLYVTESGSLTAAELAARLGVSAASVSKAIAVLEPMDLVRRSRDPRTRREHYVVDDDVWYRAWQTSARMNAMWAETGREGAEVFGDTRVGERLDQMGRFFDHISRDMAKAAERWWAELRRPADTSGQARSR